MNIKYPFTPAVRLMSVLALVAFGALTFVSCADLEDDSHFKDGATNVGGADIKFVNQSSEAYIASRSDLSKMNSLFEQNGIYEELKTKGQLSTIFVVADGDYVAPEGTADDVAFVTRSHVSDISMSPANLHDGERLMMWHKKYVNIAIGGQGGISAISFNGSGVREVIQTQNGYIYLLDKMIYTPTSLSDYINALGDDYSIFRDLVLSSGGKEFDKTNSKPVGVNTEGNTVYDTVWIYTNTHFDEVNFNMQSESLTSTMLLFSNSAIQQALDDAHARLQLWGMERPDSVLLAWIRDVAFYSERYTADQLQLPAPVETDDPSADDLTSVFGKKWRPSVQKIKPEPTDLSNAVVYEVDKFRIPNNVLIYRLKDLFCNYEFCTDQQKQDFFAMTNALFSGCETQVTGWTPLPGVWPLHENRVLILKPGDDGIASPFSVDFTPTRLVKNDNGATVAERFMIPPGTYRLAMGFVASAEITYTVTVLVNGQAVGKSEEMFIGSSTSYHYDRGAELKNTYPEGYDASKVGEISSNEYKKKAANYDTDGGPIIQQLVVPDANGDGSSVNLVLRFEAKDWNNKTKMTFNHWCLRPTDNNY